jgi:hypothetical protein
MWGFGRTRKWSISFSFMRAVTSTPLHPAPSSWHAQDILTTTTFPRIRTHSAYLNVLVAYYRLIVESELLGQHGFTPSFESNARLVHGVLQIRTYNSNTSYRAPERLKRLVRSVSH